jgi:hypothetical protein
MLGIAVCRYIICIPAVVAMTGDEIVADDGPTVQRYLCSALR